MCCYAGVQECEMDERCVVMLVSRSLRWMRDVCYAGVQEFEMDGRCVVMLVSRSLRWMRDVLLCWCPGV